MSKHTPGPWKVGTYTGDVGARQNAVRCSAGDMIADCGWSFDNDVIEANTKLIAAAPELLEAAQEYLKVIDALLLPDDEVTKRMRAAVAKAA